MGISLSSSDSTFPLTQWSIICSFSKNDSVSWDYILSGFSCLSCTFCLGRQWHPLHLTYQFWRAQGLHLCWCLCFKFISPSLIYLTSQIRCLVSIYKTQYDTYNTFNSYTSPLSSALFFPANGAVTYPVAQAEIEPSLRSVDFPLLHRHGSG